MLSHCAACPEPFRYFTGGKLYASGDRQVEEWFWLCPDCARHFDIAEGKDGGVTLIPKNDDSHQLAA